MVTISFDTKEDTSQVKTETFTIPKLSKLNKVTANTGNAEIISAVGEKVTVRASSGVGRSVQTGGSYTPSSTSPVSMVKEGYAARGKDPYFPDTITYTDGYTTLYKDPSSLRQTGTSDGSAGGGEILYIYECNYKGNKTIPSSDTRTYETRYKYTLTFNYETNTAPSVTLTTENNKTLYENDTFKIDGSTIEPDIGDIVNVYYRLNGGTSRAIATGISKGVSIPFNEQLTFKGGKLYEGETAVTDALAEGPAHRLEVWSEDNQGGKSTIAERAFYVVPNRAPALTVDAFTDQSELINNDTIKLSGVSSDPDGNDVTVKYRVNEQAAVQIHSGPAGPWSFDVSMKSLKFGENIIVVEVTDTYNFKSSKTIKLNKTENLTPLEHSVQRYTIVPPSGSAQGVLLWIQRDADQEVTAEISMTIGTEQEQFVPLPLDSTVPMGEDVEDYFKYRADTPAEHIALKLSWTGDKPITFISGALLQ